MIHSGKQDSLLQKYHELEKHSLEIENQNNLLRFELSQKAQILSQVTKELSQIQMEYKQAVDKIVELSSLKKGNNNNQTYDNKAYYQSRNMEFGNNYDAIWLSKHPDFLGKYYKKCQKNHNENIERYLNYSNEINEKSDKKINYYTESINQLKKELKRWKSFAIRVFDIASDALGFEPDFPRHDPSMQRQVAVELVEQLAKKKADDTEIQRKYQSLQNKYNSLNQYLNKVKYQCNAITEKTQNCFNISPYERTGEISRIEEIVKQDHYHKDPISLRENQKKPKSFINELDHENQNNMNQKHHRHNLNDYSDQSNHNSSSFSSFDNSFESIKNLVKSFQRQYKKDDTYNNDSISDAQNKKTKTPNVTDFSFESRNSILSDFD